MATVIRTYLVDDINGSTDNVSTVRFTLDGTSYEIDLDEANQARLRDKLSKYLIAAAIAARPRATRTGSRKPGGQVNTSPAGRAQTQAVRDWAKNAGLEVSTRGRIPTNIQEAFDQAH